MTPLLPRWRPNSVLPCRCRSLKSFDNWVHESPELLLRAAELTASYPLSLADAWIAASALEANAILVHKDPEFDAVPVAQESLPYTRAG